MNKFKDLDRSGKLLIVSLTLAIISMAMPWKDLGIISRTGLETASFLWLLLTAYPAVQAASKKKINIKLAFPMQAVALLIMYGDYQNSAVDLFDQTVNAFGIGAWVFVLHIILNIVALVLYTRDR